MGGTLFCELPPIFSVDFYRALVYRKWQKGTKWALWAKSAVKPLHLFNVKETNKPTHLFTF